MASTTGISPMACSVPNSPSLNWLSLDRLRERHLAVEKLICALEEYQRAEIKKPGARKRPGRDSLRCRQVYCGRIQMSSSTLTEEV